MFCKKIVLILITGKHREAEDISLACFEKNMELDTVGYNTLIKAMLEAGRTDCLLISVEVYGTKN